MSSTRRRMLMQMDDNPTPLIIPYQQVEYLTFNGSEYINTGILSNNRISLDIKYTVNNSNNDAPVLGGRDNANYKSFVLWTSTQHGNMNIHFCYGINDVRTVINLLNNPQLNTEYTVLITNNEIYLNNVLKYTKDSSKIQSLQYYDTELQLGTVKNGNSIDDRRLKGNVYYCKIYILDELVRNFVPVRVENEGFMYDIVSGNLYSNIGDGAFTFGPDIN